MFRNSKSGIALVIVLGFISILTLLAIGFAISMRTERLAGGISTDLVKTRALINVALARCMSDIDSNLTAPTRLMYPDWPAFGSIGSSNGPSPGLYEGLPDYQGSASWYVPSSLSVAVLNTNALWMYIEDPATGVTNGRIAYLAVNCSGFLDGNYIGATNRMYGSTPGEIAFSTLPEAQNDTLEEYREYYGRFESIYGMYQLCHVQQTNAPPFNNAISAGTASYMSTLQTHSLFPLGYYDADASATVNTQVYIGGSEADLVARFSEIDGVFSDIFGAGSEHEICARNLLDYLDEDYVPGGINGGAGPPVGTETFCTEPVPMLNELQIRSQMVFDGVDTYTLRFTVTPELYYPFYGHSNTPACEVRIDPQLVGGNFTFVPPIPAGGIILPYATGGDWKDSNPQWRASDAAAVFDCQYQDPGGAPQIAPSLQFDHFEVRTVVGGDVVDAISTPFTIDGATYLAQNPGENFYSSWDVDDPRLNWKWVTDPQPQWRDPWAQQPAARPNSLGFPNVPVSWASADGTNIMYVRNTTNLPTVGELGFLLYNSSKPWYTIRFLGPDDDGTAEVLDRFTVVTNYPNSAVGLLNPNTGNADAMRAVLHNLPFERYPGAGGTISSAQLATVRSALMGQTYANLSDLALVNSASIDGDSLLAESVIRNTCGLLSPRQNLFTIILAAQALSPVGEVLGEQRAIAIVWRDPYTSAARVEFFKWITAVEDPDG